MITIDTDHDGTGIHYFAYHAETELNSSAYWERQLTINLANFSASSSDDTWVKVQGGGDGTRYYGLDLLNGIWNDISTSADEFAASTTHNAVEVRIKKDELGSLGDGFIRVALGVVRVNQTNNEAWELGGSDVLDAMTDVSGNTWNDVQDGHVDYYADIHVSQVPFFSGNVAMGGQVAEVGVEELEEGGDPAVVAYDEEREYSEGVQGGDYPDGTQEEKRRLLSSRFPQEYQERGGQEVEHKGVESRTTGPYHDDAVPHHRRVALNLDWDAG